jgi:hypothetical protein
VSVTVGRIGLPTQKVSVVRIRTGTQLEFDHPSDMLRWFADHPNDAAAIEEYDWYVGQGPQGGH